MSKLHNSLQILGKIGNRVIQRVRPGLGNISNGDKWDLQDRALVSPAVPPTPAQLARRAQFAAAVAAWQAMSLEQQKKYKERAHARAISGFNLFLSEYMKGV